MCRQGGDEFVVLLSEIDGAEDAAASAGKLLRTLAEPYLIEGHTVDLTASIGIALYPKDGREVVDLLRSADGAMYAAKRLGRNQFQFYAMSECLQGKTGKAGAATAVHVRSTIQVAREMTMIKRIVMGFPVACSQ